MIVGQHQLTHIIRTRKMRLIMSTAHAGPCIIQSILDSLIHEQTSFDSVSDVLTLLAISSVCFIFSLSTSVVNTLNIVQKPTNILGKPR